MVSTLLCPMDGKTVPSVTWLVPGGGGDLGVSGEGVQVSEEVGVNHLVGRR